MRRELKPILQGETAAGHGPVFQASRRYLLRKGLGFWKLVFDGEDAELKHERGIYYVAWLLVHPPPEPIHALDLAARVSALWRKHGGIAHLFDPATGKAAPLQSHARLQQRGLALDAAQSARALLRKEKELQAILEDEEESEPVKAEAMRELGALADFQRQHGRRMSDDSAQRAANTVRRAIQRFHRHLSTAVDLQGNPHPVLVPFADHLRRYLLMPSGRYAGSRHTRSRAGLAGCLTYEPPPGVVWEK